MLSITAFLFSCRVLEVIFSIGMKDGCLFIAPGLTVMVMIIILDYIFWVSYKCGFLGV